MRAKKIIAGILTAVILSVSPSVFAENKTDTYVHEEIVPFYAIATTADATLTASGTTATCESNAKGNVSKVAKITAVQTLQQYWGLWVWNDVENASWTKTVNSYTISQINYKSGLSHGTYRVKTDFTLTAKDGTTETIRVYSTEQNI